MNIEVCIDTVESAINAERAGATELEVCQALNAGGLTPSYGFVDYLLEKISIPLNIMIRPRSGDFLYSDYEKEFMLKDIEEFSKLDINSIVLGGLREDGSIDKEFLEKCREKAGDKKITCHRAFDMSRDLEESLEVLIDLGFYRILTSGGRPSSYEGMDMLRSLVDLSDNRIQIMAGAGVNKNNIEEIIKKTKVDAIHFSAKSQIESKMEFRNRDISMAGENLILEYDYFYTDLDRAREMVKVAKGLGEI